MAASGVYYIGPRGSRPGGYFQRLPGHHVTRLVAFVPPAHYRLRLQFGERVAAVCRQAFPPAMQKRWAEAVSTAR